MFAHKLHALRKSATGNFNDLITFDSEKKRRAFLHAAHISRMKIMPQQEHTHEKQKKSATEESKNFLNGIT